MTRLAHALIALAIGVATAIGIPLADLWRDCRVRESEACVWGRAYLPLTLGVGAAAALVVAAVVYAALRTWGARRRRDPGD